MQARNMSSCGVCLSVCLSRSWIVWKRINISSNFFHHRVAKLFWFFSSKRHGNIPTRTSLPNGGVECRWARQKSRFWAYIWLKCLLLTLKQAGVVSTVAGGPRPPSRKLWHLSLVVSGGVDCRRRRRNVYDKKSQRYAKDNRTAHLTARSDKSVAYVTNKKRLYSTFSTVEANSTTDRHEASRGLRTQPNRTRRLTLS